MDGPVSQNQQDLVSLRPLLLIGPCVVRKGFNHASEMSWTTQLDILERRPVHSFYSLDILDSGIGWVAV